MQNPIATHNAARVICGNAALFRSGQGRCNRPDVAVIVAATLMMAYALTGFAVLHTLTLALKSRALWLGCTYAVVAVFSWPVLAMAVLGIADAVFGIRQRYLRSRPPPIPAS